MNFHRSQSVTTLLFTDIVGSTERATELGDHGWGELLQEHHRRVRREIQRFGGSVVKTLGDGVLASFRRPSQATRCAWSIRETVRELGLELRCGIHLGQVEHQGNDLSGLAVHICARIAAGAAPGEILVSNAVRETGAGEGIRFHDRGKHALKGVSGEWRLFALESLPPGPAFRTGRWVPNLSSRQVGLAAGIILGLLVLTMGILALRSGLRDVTPTVSPATTNLAPAIAVLPFRVQGEETEVLREGMVDLLSTGLNESSSIRSINPATVLARWREAVSEGREPELSTMLEIARQTGSRYAVVGAAISVGADIRLSASIFDLRTDDLLDQEQVEGPPDKILQLVDRLAVGIFQVILEHGEGEIPQINLARLMTESPQALNAYLEGEVHFRHFDIEAAEEAYKRAVEADSTFALAYYRLAGTSRWHPNPRGDPTQYLEHATALSDRLPSEEKILVKALYAAHRFSPEEIESLRELVQRHPDNAEGWFLLADTYLHVPAAFATADEIAGMFERAVDLDPKNAEFLIHHVQFAWWFEPDSVTAARRLAKWEEVAPRDPLGPAGHLAIALGFGDSASQNDAMSQLHLSSDFALVHDVFLLLHDPRYAAFPSVAQVRLRVADTPWFSANSTANLFWYYAMWRGQLREALSWIEQMDPKADYMHALLLFSADLAGLPIPQEELQRFALIDSVAEGWKVYFGGTLAADNGNWPEYSRAIAGFERRRHRALQESDSLAADRYRSVGEALEAYGSWRRGNPERALPTLSKPDEVVGGGYLSTYGRWRLARLYQDLGRYKEAERVYTSFHFASALANEPLAHFQLGKLYEALDQRESAVESYEYFVENWKYADPELQPLVEEARQAILRLRGIGRE